jgi:hypothetical protein
MEAMNIKGKLYIPVNERIKEFRNNEKYNNYSMITEIVDIQPERVLMKAIIKDENDRVVATGLAEEIYTDDYKKVNSTSMIENCETSCWGRALANLGIGVDTSVASAEEVESATKRQESYKQETQQNSTSTVNDFEIKWWNGTGPINLYEHFMVGDQEYKCMKNKTTGEYFGLNQDTNAPQQLKFYKFE